MITAVERQQIVDAATAAMQAQINELQKRIEALEETKQVRRSKAA